MKREVMALLLCMTVISGLLAGCGDNRASDQGAAQIGQETAEGGAGSSQETAEGGAGSSQETKESGAGTEQGAAESSAGTEQGAAQTGQETAEGGADPAKISLLHPIVYDYRLSGYDGENGMIMHEKYGSVRLRPDEAARWPKLAETLEAEAEREKSGAEEEFSFYYEDAKDFFAEQEYDFGGSFNCETELRVARADTAVLSVRRDYVDYLGGAHGYFCTYGQNYDTESGKQLTIADVVKDTDRLPELLCEKLLALPDAGDWLDAANLQKMLREYEPGELYNWLIGYDGVSFYFSPYSIAAYAAGQFSVKLLFEDYPGLFEEKYSEAPACYAEPIAPDNGAYADLDGDGKREEIRYCYRRNYDYDGIEAIVISAGNVTEAFDTYCYNTDGYLLHTGNGNYLYLFCSGDNDFVGLEVYELSERGIRKCGDGMGGHCAELYHDGGYRDAEERIYYSESAAVAFTDPDRFGLVSQMYSLGCLFGYRQYHVGRDGFPESDMTCFAVSADWTGEWLENDRRNVTFTALQDMEMQGLADDYTETGESVAVRAGQALEILRTDNQLFADFRLEDGRLARAVITAEEWPYTICGIPMEEALDGIIYAG